MTKHAIPRAKRHRKQISKRVRFFVLQRDDFKCRYCGVGPQDDQLHVDHVHPVVMGGTDDPGNLVTACRTCNLGKGSALVGDTDEGRLRAMLSMAVEAIWTLPVTDKTKASVINDFLDGESIENLMAATTACCSDPHLNDLLSALRDKRRGQ